MRIPDEELKRAFAKIAAVREHMAKRAVEGLQLKLEWRTLADVIADMYGLEISVNEVQTSGFTVAGNVERYSDNRAVILVRAQQTEGMLRYVTVKELCHLMIDEEDDWSCDALGTIKEMKVEFDKARADGNGVENPSRRQMSEYLAEVAAIALMYPCEFHASDQAKIDANEKTIARIALEHDCPGWAVETALNHSHIFQRFGC